MKPIFPFVALLLSFMATISFAQHKHLETYAVGFYNLENLFDTIHDKGKNDYEYLPTGTYKWGDLKYRNKIERISTVLADMATDISSAGMAVVGVSEVENSSVLQALVESKELKSRGWKYIHVDGADMRGVDCALLYNPLFYTPISYKLVPYLLENGSDEYKTRGFLVVSGKMCGEHLCFIVNHWPSRRAKSHTRERAAIQVRALKDSIMLADPESKIIIMGDMNDNPDNNSMKISLGALLDRKELKRTSDIFNPWYKVLRNDGIGTLNYRGKWNLYDQIVFTANLVGKDCSTLKYDRAEVFSRSYMFQSEGKYKGLPKRTHAAGVWLDGYSDHLPVIIYLVKGAI